MVKTRSLGVFRAVRYNTSVGQYAGGHASGDLSGGNLLLLGGHGVSVLGSCVFVAPTVGSVDRVDCFYDVPGQVGERVFECFGVLFQHLLNSLAEFSALG